MHKYTRLLLGIGLVFLAWQPATSWSIDAGEWERMRGIAPRDYLCRLCGAAPQIDGRIDDMAWEAATWSEDFVDIEGSVKPKPKHRTRTKMVWDKDYFYVAAELDEPHVWGTLTDHDAVIFRDNDFELFIDPDGDNHQYYELELNALNTTWDLLLTRPYKDSGYADNSFELAGLKSAVHVSGTLNDASDRDVGWTLELAIPWSALAKFARQATPPNMGDQWRINYSRVQWQHEIMEGSYRKVASKREDNWVWSPQGIIDMHRPERWGIVRFVNTDSTDSPTEKVDRSRMVGRDGLMEIYHRQRSFQKKNTRWASSLAELGFGPNDIQASDAFEMRLTIDGYEATWYTPATDNSHDKSYDRMHVRQDSRLWMADPNPGLETALGKSGSNRRELQKALDSVPPQQREAMEFLVANMPERDLHSLTAEFLLENVRFAYGAWNEAPWKAQLPKEIFLNNVLPYANINEGRDAWRADFRKRFLPLIAGAKTPEHAAALLNQKLFALTNVRYSTQRKKADQSPYESIKSGLASCTGLSVMLIDACRALGVPARFVGTPLWTDNSGNHSWIEVWDNGWHFTGAAEPSGDVLDKAWFVDRASTAKRDEPMNAIYAVSFQRTPLKFPLVWDSSIDYISAVNVTDRYVNRGAVPPAGSARAMFRVLDAQRQRVAAEISIFDASGKRTFVGTSKDERFDANDHVGTFLPLGEYSAQIELAARSTKSKIEVKHPDQTFTFDVGSERVPAP